MTLYMTVVKKEDGVGYQLNKNCSCTAYHRILTQYRQYLIFKNL